MIGIWVERLLWFFFIYFKERCFLLDIFFWEILCNLLFCLNIILLLNVIKFNRGIDGDIGFFKENYEL